MGKRGRTIALLLIIITIFWVNLRIPKRRRRIPLNTTQYRFIKDYIISPSYEYYEFCQKSPFIIIIVSSYVGNVELRNLFRQHFMSQAYLETKNTIRIFLLAKIPPHEKSITQSLIEEESDKFHDILQGSFVESYRNLTIKHLMGLQWVSENCPNAFYVLKVDDDTVFRFETLFNALIENKIKGDFLLGYKSDTRPKRDNTSKWYVSLEEYKGELYPDFVSGWYYVTIPTVAAKLVNEAMYHPYFWIDDVLITGILSDALNIKRYELPEEFYFENKVNLVIHNNKDVWDAMGITGFNHSFSLVNLFLSSYTHGQ